MKIKFLVTLVFVILTLLLSSNSLLAVSEVKTPSIRLYDPLNLNLWSITNSTAISEVRGLTTTLISWLILVAGLMSLIYLVIGGFKWLSAQGDPKALSAAQQTIVGAIIGFLITFAAYWIIEILQTIFGISILASLIPPAQAQVNTGDSFKLQGNLGIDAVFRRTPMGIGSFISSILSAAVTVAGLAFLGYFILGAFKFITAGGDQKAIDGAKKTLTSAAIGLLIVFTSYWIIEILQTITGVPILP
ncbi:MAG: hypothetical protein A3F33_02375 [Candidatus Woykebacteria bacterium RIFCSPHIGHO2_12_FULL_43_10]|uniref:Uncharacterized protein n=2 Tax=Candidatus Woykeibacteriota TaxID=1817899 RepID=A0A1G1WTP9_9BACT|nr:MAG: hypothetical protein A2802_00890 [Candidatus Woykebacteria bacterium RIFCSPHIGHO2_01_FULL_43_29]OGY28474.1 MAG: hypothetical protein A3J50_00425 [Candidatus Woykebacteria bacterium RIFCSPHIGHO2_02_FULL_43_16b]OGY28819.1 MAG: hypothetical protein A3F33_02375 [Candidatus Woykebacteria bacterium RIFCSPHIGHO2_12_FULL_43_10]OGY31094.1 MAG: hypothetical protein A3A61_04015 [Candidatus Woykebacteria bacterium RIFCSPLOWO2_01_FULL_43_14]